MRAAVESRRRLARGPRSGSTVADAQTGGGQPMLPSEDHRVVSTVYQAADTQALMRVTLLAAGFVIGARGISARLIGQVTGAIVQSWTESCRYSLNITDSSNNCRQAMPAGEGRGITLNQMLGETSDRPIACLL